MHEDAAVAMQQFARVFLELPRRFPLGNRVSLGLIALFAGGAVASLWLPYRVVTPLASQFVIVEGPRIEPMLRFLDRVNAGRSY